MSKLSTAVLLALCVAFSTCSLQMSSPQNLNYYLSFQGEEMYYDTGSYQVFLTQQGYSVVNDATQSALIFDNPSCVGTNNSEFFCIDSLNSSYFNQINLTTGQEVQLYPFNSSIYSLTSYLNAVIVSFESYFTYFQVVVPPSQTPVCDIEPSGSLNSAIYYDGMVFTTPSSPCTSGSCSFQVFFCGNSSSTTWTVNIPSNQINNYIVTPMFFSENNVTQVVGFTTLKSTSVITGFIWINNQTYNNTLGSLISVKQINLTNILVVNSQMQLVQYYFNVSTGTFTQVGNTVVIPSAISVLLSPIPGPNQAALIMSLTQGFSNFYVNVNTMSIVNWLYLQPAQAFTNGTLFSFSSTGYFLASTNGSILYVYDSLTSSNPASFTPYQYPFSYPTTAYAFVSPFNSNVQLFSLDLTGTAQGTYTVIPGTSGLSNLIFTSVNANGSNYVISVYDSYPSGNVTFFSTNGGSLFSINGQGSNSYAAPMVFVNPSTNVAMIYMDTSTLTINTLTWNVSTSDFSQQFGATQKLTESLFLGYSINENTDLNITVVNAFSQTISQSFVIPNTTEIDVNGVEVYATLTSAGDVEAIFASAMNENGISMSWVIYASDNSNYTTNTSTVAMPGNLPGTALFCNLNFDQTMASCVNYAMTDSNGGGSNSSGSSSTIIIIAIVVVVVLAAGLLVRRSIIRKRQGGLNTSGITLAKV